MTKPQNHVSAQRNQAPSNGLGIAGFVLSLLGLVLFWFPFVGVVLAIIGVILSAVAMANGRKRGASTGLALAGLVLGLVALVPLILIIIFGHGSLSIS